MMKSVTFFPDYDMVPRELDNHLRRLNITKYNGYKEAVSRSKGYSLSAYCVLASNQDPENKILTFHILGLYNEEIVHEGSLYFRIGDTSGGFDYTSGVNDLGETLLHVMRAAAHALYWPYCEGDTPAETSFVGLKVETGGVK